MFNLINTYFNTKPFFIHSNGSRRKNPQGNQFRREVLEYMDSHPYLGEGGMRDTIYFTCNSRMEEYGTLEKTLRYFKVPYVVKGHGTEGWRNTMKAPLLVDYVSQATTKYTMGIDCYDVCLIKEANELVDIFEREFDCDMLFNGELISYPPNNDLAEFERSRYGDDSPFCYLNSGVWIARTEFLREISEDIVAMQEAECQRSRSRRSDQIVYRYLHKKYYPRIQLDKYCKLFQVTCNSSSQYLRDRKYDPTNAYTINIERKTEVDHELSLDKEM